MPICDHEMLRSETRWFTDQLGNNTCRTMFRMFVYVCLISSQGVALISKKDYDGAIKQFLLVRLVMMRRLSCSRFRLG